MDELARLRERIVALDQEILSLLEARFDLAERVGRLKARRGRPILARSVERRILARARGAARRCGVAPETLEAIFDAILRGSVERQLRGSNRPTGAE